jgi:hypothetical protein
MSLKSLILSLVVFGLALAPSMAFGQAVDKSGKGAYSVPFLAYNPEGKENLNDHRKVWLNAGSTVTVRVLTDKPGDVDLYIDDPTGKQIAQDTSTSKDCLVTFQPAQAGFYTLVLDNLGNAANSCQVTYTSAAIGVGGVNTGNGTYRIPFLAHNPEGKESLNDHHKVYFTAGTSVTVKVIADKAGDVDLYIDDPSGKQITQDTSTNKDATVTFRPAQSGYYNLVVDNLGSTANSCTVTYTSTK